MADAPTGGGGSNWGTFEVIIGLLLAIGLFSNITGKPVTPITETENIKKETVVTLDDSSKRCGLSVTSPISLEKIYGSVHLSGSVNGCNWKPDGNKALFAQIINGAGVPVSDFITVQNNDSSILTTAFDTTILINGNPKGTGYLLLIPALQDPEKPITIRIPIKFVQN